MRGRRKWTPVTSKSVWSTEGVLVQPELDRKGYIEISCIKKKIEGEVEREKEVSSIEVKYDLGCLSYLSLKSFLGRGAFCFYFLKQNSLLYFIYQSQFTLSPCLLLTPISPTSPPLLLREGEILLGESTKSFKSLEAGLRPFTLYLDWQRYPYITNGHQNVSSYTRDEIVIPLPVATLIALAHNCHPNSEGLVKSYAALAAVSLESVGSY